jgi:hypothetical protein
MWLLAGCSSTGPNTVCQYNGRTYGAGSSFPSGCNSCSCAAGGQVACTLRACAVDAQATDDMSAPTCSLDRTYGFWADGGLRAYADRSTLTPPSTHTLSRDTFANAPPTTCSRAMPCGNDDSENVGTSDIVLALSHPDVGAALAMASPPFYGTDSRPVDGTVFVFQRDDGRGFTLGDGDVPVGLRALQTMLGQLATETIASPSCANLPTGR